MGPTPNPYTGGPVVLMDLLIILTFDLIFMINCITLHCYDRNFFLDCQFCVLLYPLFI